MGYLLGIDLGTSSVKALIIDEQGQEISQGQVEYQFDIPREGWAEHHPDDWWSATERAIKIAIDSSPSQSNDIRAIGLSGQMHGLVPLDINQQPVRKAIIWCDQRSKEEVGEINEKIGKEDLGRIAHSPIATGFQTASLLWMKKHEPNLYEKTTHVILPKDYVRYKLTGELGTDITDAASTLALDCNTGKWSEHIIKTLGLDMGKYPSIHSSDDIAGTITKDVARFTGLIEGTPVVFGGADQVMQSIGNGIIHPHTASITIGTGGQVFAPLELPVYDKKLRAHTFSSIHPNSWYFMGASLSSGQSLKWFRSITDSQQSYKEIDSFVEKIHIGSDGLLFLPYLSGERTPHMDPHARGTFFGLTLHHNRYHMMRAVMEGAVFSLRDSLQILQHDLQQQCNRIIASGGGSHSRVWLQIQANILNREIYTSRMKEQASVGAAIVAGVGIGLFNNYEQACNHIVSWNKEPILPQKNLVNFYDDYYYLYQDLYSKTHDSMKRIGKLAQLIEEIRL